jgi:hypothetical protein
MVTLMVSIYHWPLKTERLKSYIPDCSELSDAKLILDCSRLSDYNLHPRLFQIVRWLAISPTVSDCQIIWYIFNCSRFSDDNLYPRRFLIVRWKAISSTVPDCDNYILDCCRLIMPRRVMYRVVESTSEEEGFKSSSLIQTGPQVIKAVQ